MDTKEQIIQTIEDNRETYIALSKKIWSVPELRFDLPEATRSVKELLASENFRIQSGLAGMEHAFVAEFGDGSPVIGILAEFDALSSMSQAAGVYERKPLVDGGSGHGCGHHLLGMGAVAGAIAIKQYLEANRRPGTIRLYGCPAEESGYGKAFMARAGIFGGEDAYLTWHPWDTNGIWDQATLAVSQFYFSFTGTSAHAGGAPELGRSALDAAELMNVGVNFLREHIIDEARVHYAFLDAGGTAANVVQSTSRLHYFVRAPGLEQMAEIYERIFKIAKGAAMMTETTVDIQWDGACANFIVNRTLARAMYANMQRIFPMPVTEAEAENYAQYRQTLSEPAIKAIRQRTARYFPSASPDEIDTLNAKSIQNGLVELSFPAKLMTASTDVGDPSWFAPTVQMIGGCMPYGTAAHSWQWVSAGLSSIAFKGMLSAAKAIALTAYDILDNPDLLAQAKAEHQKNLGGQTYRNPVPLDILPH